MSNWRLIEDGAMPAAYNMAMDEALALAAAIPGEPGHAVPTLRLYTWDRPSVSLGSFQGMDEIDAGYCDISGIPVVRRPTGGRGILHGVELTYGFSAPTYGGLFAGGLFDSYRLLGEAFLLAFRSLGIPCESESRKRGRAGHTGVCFQSTSYGEISVAGRKIIGSAQRRLQGSMLQQGSIPLELDYEGMGRVFLKGAADRAGMAGLREIVPGLTETALRDAIVMAAQETFGVRLNPVAPSPREQELADRLKVQRYESAEWTRRRGRDSNRQEPQP